MFQIVESDSLAENKARISDDNLCITWPKGEAPNWNRSWTPEYAKEFELAIVDYGIFEAECERAILGCEHHVSMAFDTGESDSIFCSAFRDLGHPNHLRPGGRRKYNADLKKFRKLS